MAGKPRRVTPDQLRSRLWFDNPDNPGHDRALSRALPEFRPDGEGAAIGQADHRHRPDRLRSLALQPPPSRAREARARRHHRGRRRRASSSRAIRSRRPASGRPPASTATSPICRSSRCSTATPRRRRAADRLRQDHAGLPDGGRDREHPGDLAQCRARCSTAGTTDERHRLRHRRLEGARAPRRRRHRLPAVHRHRRLARRPPSATATPWAPPRP